MLLEEDKLRDFLVSSGLVNREDIDVAPAEKPISDFLVSEGLLSESDLKRAESHVTGIPFMHIDQAVITAIPFDVLSIIPEPIARRHNVAAIDRSGDLISVAVVDLNSLQALDFLKRRHGLKISPQIAASTSIKKVLLKYQEGLRENYGATLKKEAGEIEDFEVSELEDKARKEFSMNLPTVRLFDTLLRHAILQKASDIHIEPTEGGTIIRYRIDGVLHDSMTLPKRVGTSIALRAKFLSNLDLSRQDVIQSGHFQMNLDEEKTSFRISVAPILHGEKVVLRVLSQHNAGYTLGELDFSEENQHKIYDSISTANGNGGMILVSGPFGSGRTTTLYTLIDLLNTPDSNISTIENPIESQIPRVNQLQVNSKTGITTETGLRTLLKQDADVIMIGDMDNSSIATISANASTAGKLILSSADTKSAAGVVARLNNLGIPDDILNSNLKIVINQRLVNRLSSDPEKREKYFLKKAGVNSLAKIADLEKVKKALVDAKLAKADTAWEKIPFWRSVGDAEKSSGQVGIQEVLVVDNKVKNLIEKNSSTEQITKSAAKDGMMTLVEDALFKAANGLITIEDVLSIYE